MMRILGIVCGAAIAVALLTWFVGVPQFTSQRFADNAEPISVVALPSPQPKVANSPPGEALSPQETTSPAGETLSPQETLPPADASMATAPAATDTPPAPTEAPEPAIDLYLGEAVTDTLPANEPPDQWYAFWSPFRSEIAANGFVTELQRVTGLDYRVVKVKPGVYEVAFAYADEDSLEQYLSTISAATGLDLPGSP